jgi:hypothetical protein
MRWLAILGACALAASSASALAAPKAPAHHKATEVRQVLPTTLTPSHYDLRITPDADHLTFKGEVEIVGLAAQPGRQVVLNAKGLTLDKVTIDGGQSAAVTLDDKLGRATLSFAEPYGAGQHKLSISYHGPITKGTLGFFAMDYDSPAGKPDVGDQFRAGLGAATAALLGRAGDEGDLHGERGCADRPDGDLQHAGGGDDAPGRRPAACAFQGDAANVDLSAVPGRRRL